MFGFCVYAFLMWLFFSLNGGHRDIWGYEFYEFFFLNPHFNENQECKVRPEIINVNNNESVFYPFSIKTSNCSSSCNNINDPYTKICVPNVIKDLNVKVFNLMLRTNETRHIKWHETCKCKCRLDASVCNNKQHWNNDKCQCECKESIDKGICNKVYIWNPSNCKCDVINHVILVSI